MLAMAFRVDARAERTVGYSSREFFVVGKAVNHGTGYILGKRGCGKSGANVQFEQN